MKTILIYIFCLLVGVGGLWAQEQTPTDSTQASEDNTGLSDSPLGPVKMELDSLLGFRIAPLDTLIERAIANATELSGQDALIESRKAALRAQKREWMKFLQPIGSITYGTGTINAAIDDGTNTTVNFATNQNLIYNVGVTMRFTLEDLLNRKPKHQVIEWQIEQLRENRKTQIRLIRERVIMRYESLWLAAESMKLRAEMMQTNAVAYELAERYFHQGDLSYGDFNGALEAKVYSETQFIGARSDFQKNYLLLREVVGGPLD